MTYEKKQKINPSLIVKKIEDEKKRQAIQELLSSGKITQEELDKIGE